jgi:hypothetical protein
MSKLHNKLYTVNSLAVIDESKQVGFGKVGTTLETEVAS